MIGATYRVIGPIGSGGMGMVLLAEDETLHRKVAIKLIRPALLGPDFRERFISEARAMARVNDPNVLQIYAFGEHMGAPYLVMEFVEGRTIEQWLAEGTAQLDIDVVLRILDGMCHGVSAIHAVNTVHRDLKPSNVLLDAEFRPRIADLGLAVLLRNEASDASDIVGTPAYMAPEIAFPGDLDAALRPRADVYSLGCIAYELLTRRSPYENDSPGEVIGQMGVLLQHAIKVVKPPTTVRPDLPAAFDHAIMRALAKDPKERTPSAEAFRRDLIAARDGNREPARILVAEDDSDFRDLLEITLHKEFPDADIECVADGKLALEAFDRRQASVAILDLRMPKLDGMELTKILRTRTSAAAMPIIVLTASGGPDEWRQLSALGADRLLVKPVHLDDVVALVRRALKERTSGA